MRSILLPVFLLLAAFAANAQQIYTPSSRMETLVDRLRDEAETLADAAVDSVKRGDGSDAALLNESFFAVQFAGSARLLRDLVRGQRPVGEVRSSIAIVDDLTRRTPSGSALADRWQSIRGIVADISAEIGTDAGDRPNPENRPVAGRVFWRGMVDDKLQLLIKGNQIEYRTVSGRTMPNGTFSFTTRLPESDVFVGVTKAKGRGTVRVVEQPASSNDFTAVVEIYDSGGGAKEYELEIYWK
ncbi:MAG TPA: hypothetical protein PKO33_03175 [Pyrinomonadaceae bacterium]|nr:hypothetical protein [Pyrinomonadaceae bacterium]